MSCFKEFAKYTSLNIIGMLSISCYILADTFFVSVGLGANGLAALNFAIPVFGFIIGSSLMLGIGGATKYAILKSQNNMIEANRVFTHTVFIMTGFIVAFFTAGLFFSDAITRIFGTNEEVFPMTQTYLRIILLFAPIFLVQYLLMCFIRNDGAPQLSMIAMVSGSFSNIALDYVFIIMLRMGMFGAALATGISAVISLIILCTFFIKKKNNFRLTRCAFAGLKPSQPYWLDFVLASVRSAALRSRSRSALAARVPQLAQNAGDTRRSIRSIFSIGLPSLVAELSVSIVMIVFNIIIWRLQGNIGVAAYGIIANISIVLIAIYTGIAHGIQPIISSNYGSGNTANVKAILRYALILMATISIVVYSCVFFGATQIVAIFNSEQNALLQNIATSGIKIYFIACIFAGFNIIMSAYFTSIEYPRPAHVISILRGFLIIIPMGLLLSAIGGITWVWCAFPATELLVAGVGLAAYLIYQKKKQKELR
ncbi:MAG: MATE family efflux transporter [Spirochaetes bacterium]|nr:MATE family efflux transporter [Spirochaetota bacterium]